MAKLDYRQCVAKAFDPLVRASARTELANKLKALPPPEEDKEAQFAKFKSMKRTEFPPLFLPNGGFFFPFYIGNTKCFAFSSFIDENDLNRQLENWLRQNDSIIDFVDQSSFLFLSYYTSNYYTLRPEYQSRREAAEIVGLADFDEYIGHDVDDLIKYYRPTYILSLPPDSLLSDYDPYAVATELLALVPSLRSPLIDDDFAESVHELLSIPSIKAESLYLCLTSTRWRYSYLEVFRIIEAVLYMPWLQDLVGDLSSDLDIQFLYACLRKNLEWREGKGRSIERVFDEVPADTLLSQIESKIAVFKDILSAGEFARSSLGKRIYKIRNQLVHPEDFTDGSVLEVPDEEFRLLALYLVTIAGVLYGKYDRVLRAYPSR